jgi:hypothetical protein
MSTERNLRRAERVQRWLDDPLFNEVLEDLSAEQVASFVQSRPGDVDIRERAYTMLKAIEALKERLQYIASETAHARASAETRTLTK